MSVRQISSLGVEEPGTLYLWEYEEGPAGPGEVRIETLYSGFSAGTELTFVKGSNPYLHSSWDPGRQLFDAGTPGQHYPVPFLGYMEVGRVIESNARGYAAGDVVCGTWGHKSGHTTNPDHDLLVKLPEGLDPVLGVFVGQMGPIAANGVLHADAELAGLPVLQLGQGVRDRAVLVVGGGTVGALCALFAQRSGADVLVAEPDGERRDRLERLGLATIGLINAAEYAKDRWHHAGSARGADVVLQTRAHPAALHEAMRALRAQGAVIDLAFYQGGTDALRLGEEFHHNALTLRCAQIGRTPRGTETTWDRERLARETIRLMQGDADRLRDELITHVVPIGDAPGFIGELRERRFPFGQIVFSYPGSGE